MITITLIDGTTINYNTFDEINNYDYFNDYSKYLNLLIKKI
jgi:hypothetical protein